jgi:PEP-CTERM motif
MRIRAIRAAIVAAGLLGVAGIAGAAQADDIDTYVQTSSAWIDPATGSINGRIHWAGNPGGEGAAVGRILLQGTDASHNAQSIPVYCVDVADVLGNGTFYKEDLGTLTFTETQKTNIIKFITYGDALVNAATGAQKTLDAAATQLGVWELLNETASPNWDVLAGNFYVSRYDNDAIFAAAALANTWLTSLKSGDIPMSATQTLSVLDPGHGNQTQVYITARGNGDINEPGVPEPATWGMIVLGFGLLGGALRRRKQEEVFA